MEVGVLGLGEDHGVSTIEPKGSTAACMACDQHSPNELYLSRPLPAGLGVLFYEERSPERTNALSPATPCSFPPSSLTPQ